MDERVDLETEKFEADKGDNAGKMEQRQIFRTVVMTSKYSGS